VVCIGFDVGSSHIKLPTELTTLVRNQLDFRIQLHLHASVRSVTVPDWMEMIEANDFRHCPALRNVIVDMNSSLREIHEFRNFYRSNQLWFDHVLKSSVVMLSCTRWQYFWWTAYALQSHLYCCDEWRNASARQTAIAYVSAPRYTMTRSLNRIFIWYHTNSCCRRPVSSKCPMDSISLSPHFWNDNWISARPEIAWRMTHDAWCMTHDASRKPIIGKLETGNPHSSWLSDRQDKSDLQKRAERERSFTSR
jgi:hypothetical protein